MLLVKYGRFLPRNSGERFIFMYSVDYNQFPIVRPSASAKSLTLHFKKHMNFFYPSIFMTILVHIGPMVEKIIFRFPEYFRHCITME